ncbi:MAG: RES family NAD+ phosphorylase [Deltaproteobacteria bacterium]|nr:RES family NAD+ phosphorylase [Deltaproteobacteria bacterium]
MRGMIHDQDLVDQLAGLATERFDGEVFRATRPSADPIAASIIGGRWAPGARSESDAAVLYTSLESDGALAEVVTFLAEQTPMPGPRPLKVSRLGVSTAKTLRLARAHLERLGVEMSRYGERDYGRTQEIGAALSFLGLDGLIAPSARWPCDNLMIFANNHSLTDRLEVIGDTEVEWRSWAEAHGLLKVR